MLSDSSDYSIYFRFLEAYTQKAFLGIDRKDSLVTQIEEFTEVNNQFFYVADLIQIKFHFVSSRSSQMLGINPEELSPYHFMGATHPDDIQRLNLGRSKIIKMAQELFIAEKGNAILATNYRVRNRTGVYADLLMQCYIFYTTIPYKTVFFLKIHTNIDWHKKIRFGYHYYKGDDLSNFRYPDDEMLAKGNVFSGREFEILKLVEAGTSSDRIAEKLFLSPHTVNTHRRNILEKSGKDSMQELIHELKERGVM